MLKKKKKREKTPKTDTETVDRSLQEARSLQLSALKNPSLLFISSQPHLLRHPKYTFWTYKMLSQPVNVPQTFI